MTRSSTTLFVLLASGLGLAACGDSGSAGPQTAPARFTVTPGVQLATVTGADPGEKLTLVDGTGNRKLTLIADKLGQAVFAYIPSQHAVIDPGSGELPAANGGEALKVGTGYVIRDEEKNPVEASGAFSVHGRDDHPDESLYTGQSLQGVPMQVIGGKPIDGQGVPGESRLNRRILPGTQVTLDYNAQRMNIEADAAGTIKKINCG